MLVDTRQEWGPPPVTLGAVLRRAWIYVALAAVVGGIVGFAVSGLVGSTYRTKANVYFSDPESTAVFAGTVPAPAGDALVVAAQRMATSEAVLRTASDQLGNVTVDQLRSRITATALPKVGALEVKATAPTAEASAATAQALIKALGDRIAAARRDRATRTTQLITPYIKELGTRIATLDAAARAVSGDSTSSVESRRALTEERAAVFEELLAAQSKSRQLALDAAAIGSGIFSVDPIEVPTAPTRPQKALGAMAGATIGLLVSLGIAWRRTERLATEAMVQGDETRARRMASVDATARLAGHTAAAAEPERDTGGTADIPPIYARGRRMNAGDSAVPKLNRT